MTRLTVTMDSPWRTSTRRVTTPNPTRSTSSEPRPASARHGKRAETLDTWIVAEQRPETVSGDLEIDAV